jgi:hypothetical protein
MILLIDRQGQVRCLCDETIPLASLGQLVIRRASIVEPDADGFWHADLTLVGGPVLGLFPQRSQALAAEQRWLETFWLGCPAPPATNHSGPPDQSSD